MGEFLKDYYSFLTHSVEFLAALTGIIFYKKYCKTAAKILIPFLVFAFLLDILHNYPKVLRDLDKFYIIENTIFEKNYWLSNILWFIGLVGFTFYINFKIIVKPLYKSALKYCLLGYFLMFFTYSLFNFNLLFTTLSSFIATLSLWMVFVTTSIFYLETLQSDKILNFHKSIYFYINSCVLLWSLIVVPLAFYEKYFNTSDLEFIILKGYIFLFINIIFYTTLTLALIFCKPETK